jgi:crotonobetainyl-CoA:carnitine CoA-transferase CaiB-like acyl-CoA transferase
VTDRARQFLEQFLDALGGPGATPAVELPTGGSLPSVFAVSDLAQASVGAAAASLARLVALDGGAMPTSTVDRDLASAWFGYSIRPSAWELPSAWDSIAGDYPTSDGWIKLHTNAPHHRAAALTVLGVPGDREAVTTAVSRWPAEDLENAVAVAGGAAAALRSGTEWDAHPQGRAVAAEPLLHLTRTSQEAVTGGKPRGDRPLEGIRVLDLTRVLAGPVATRLLAGWGAEVLRIDPPSWDEPGLAPEVTLGKRCARLDLTSPTGRDRFLELLAAADVLVHGYRSDAMEGLGLGADLRHDVRPGLVDVSLDAYGWSGPWATRRGFDSLVQMSSGIAEAGMDAAGAGHPVPLPVQALDQATGYLLAAAVLTGLALRRADGMGSGWRTSLARMGRLLMDAGTVEPPDGPGIDPAPPRADDPVERTPWGDARRLPPPVVVDGAPLHWTLPAGHLGASDPIWLPG